MINKKKLFDELKEMAADGPVIVTAIGRKGTRRQLIRDVIVCLLDEAGGFNVGIAEHQDDSTTFAIERNLTAQPKRKGRKPGCAPPLMKCNTCGRECAPATKTCFSCGNNPRKLAND